MVMLSRRLTNSFRNNHLDELYISGRLPVQAQL